MAFWQADETTVTPPAFYTTAEGDETVAIDVTALLVSAGAPSVPQTVLFTVVDNAPDTAVTLADTPTLVGNIFSQRLRGLTANTTYRLRGSFLTSGNRRPFTLFVVVRE